MAIVQNPQTNNEFMKLLAQLVGDYDKKRQTSMSDAMNEIEKFYVAREVELLKKQQEIESRMKEVTQKQQQMSFDEVTQTLNLLLKYAASYSKDGSTHYVNDFYDKMYDKLLTLNRINANRTDLGQINDDDIDEWNEALFELRTMLLSFSDDYEKVVKELNQNQESLDALRLKKQNALNIAEQNWSLHTPIQTKLYEQERLLQEKEDQIEFFKILEEANQELTEDQKKEYKNLIEEKKKEDEKYFQLRKAMIMQDSRTQRMESYKRRIQELQDEAKAQKQLNKLTNKGKPDVIRSIDKKIDEKLKKDIKTEQDVHGISSESSKIDGILKLVQSFENGSGIATSISNMIGGAEAGAGMAEAAGISSAAAGPIGIIIMVLQGIAKIVNAINQQVAEGVQKAMSAQMSYMSAINTRLQGIAQEDINYYTQMTEWQSDNDFGLAIGKWNAFVDKQKYIEQLNNLIQAGIAYNAEERALLQTISDKLVTTFDVMDTSLTRLVRLQQRDITYAAMGSESLLTQFLNRFAQMGGLPDTTYLSDVYDSVSAILLDAVSKLTSDQASAWSYEVQKWLGSLYSLGLSQEGVQQLAQGITYLQTGNVSDLMQNQSLQYLYTAAAERAGLSIADILVQGIDVETTNTLLSSVVTLLQDIYNNSSTNAVQSAWTTITGMSIADLRAMTNVSSDYLAYISSEHQDWTSSWTEAEKQLNLATSSFRTSAAEAITNIINNALLNVGQRITDETFASAGIDTNWLNDDLQRYLNLASLFVPINFGNAVEDVGNIGQAIVSTGKGLISSESGSSTLAGALNDLLGIGGMSKYTMYYLAQTVGGTVGNIVESMITIPEVIKEIQGMMDWYRTNNYSTLASVKESLALDTRMFESTSTLSKVIDSLQNEMIIERTGGYSESTLFSDVKGLFSDFGALWNTIVDKIESGIPNAGIAFDNAIDQFNTKLESLINNQNALTNISIDSQDNNIQAITSFAAQAEQTERALETISNQSAEDRAIIEQADNIQSYLFENERLIRVSLSYIEPAAYQELNDTTLSDEKRELIEAILNIMRDKVPVDLIDNDVNTITRNLYNIKWS